MKFEYYMFLSRIFRNLWSISTRAAIKFKYYYSLCQIRAIDSSGMSTESKLKAYEAIKN